MKISVNSIRAMNSRYDSAADPAPDGVDKLVERIGAQLAAVEGVIPFGDKYDGAVIVRVVSCEDHPNADRLHVCRVDDGGKVADVVRGDDGLVEVVCGAPNVHAGMIAVWLPPGSTVPSSYGSDPFVLEARELRGVVSNGMLASPKELALGDNHDGILEIDPEVDGDIVPGTYFADQYNLRGDAVIDMENKMFTHRPDLFGVLGVAREIAGIQGQKFTSPEWYTADASIDAPEAGELTVEVRNEIPELVPRFAVVPMSGITVRPSPVWLQVELSRLGVRPINNIVDLTNYFMLLTAQPLHAYDYDKVVAQDSGADHATIVIRQPHDGEKLLLLNGKEIEPRPEAIMIATDSRAIGLGGVMGGGDTEVDENTTNIILESATFDMYSIRRTAMAHGIFTDAVTRFNKGQSPLQNMAVLAKIAEDVAKIAGGKVAGPAVDDNHVNEDAFGRQSLYPPETVSVDFINQRLGLELTDTEMVTLLENVGFHVHDMGELNEICYAAPFWRTDIEIPEDIVEEIGRLYGFDKLPLELPKRDLTPASKNLAFELKATVRDRLADAGANEVLTYSFVHGQLLDKAGQDKDLAFKLSNALSPDLHYYRLSLTPSLLEKVHANIKAGYDEFALFEIGKVHATSEIDEDGLPREFDRLALVFAAEPKKATAAYAGAPYYQARKYLQALFDQTDLPLSFVPLSGVSFEGHESLQQMAAPYDPARSAGLLDGERIVGVVGEYKPSVAKALKLPKFAAGFEVFLSATRNHEASSYIRQSRFPKVWQDICLRLPSTVGYQELHDFVWQKLNEDTAADRQMTLEPLDIYQKPDEPDYRQITFRFSIASYEKTMTDPEVAAMLDTVADAAKDKFGADRV